MAKPFLLAQIDAAITATAVLPPDLVLPDEPRKTSPAERTKRSHVTHVPFVSDRLPLTGPTPSRSEKSRQR